MIEMTTRLDKPVGLKVIGAELLKSTQARPATQRPRRKAIS
jgi:hypothetical protein